MLGKLIHMITQPIVGPVVSLVVGLAVYESGRRNFHWLVDKITGGYDRFFKDKDLKARLAAKMFQLQKKLKTNSGKEKMQRLVDYAKMIIPGQLDDIIIQKLCESVYQEFIDMEL